MEYVCKYVYENEKISDGIYKLEISGSFSGSPGQFYMLRCWEREPVLSRPLSICNLEKDRITFLYQVVGRGTRRLCRLRKGDEISLLGPLGNGFCLDDLKGRIAVMTGGIGIAPMFYLILNLRNYDLNNSKSSENLKIDLYAGFKNEVYSIEKLEPSVDNIFVTTESGKYGRKGLVTENFKAEFYDRVLCCGPESMMKKVAEECVKKGTVAYLSMERRMACGIGACLGCTCNTISGNKRVCRDGPVFSGGELVW